MAQQRGGRGRGRRRVRKNIPFGQAHIKTSFNNTIVALTDRRPSVKQGPDPFRGSLGTAVEVRITAGSKAHGSWKAGP